VTKMRGWFHLAVIALVSSAACAAPASPHGHVFDQPDGSMTPELFLQGNQHYAWMEDGNGYSVLQDDGGWWVYAKKVDGELVSSGARIGYGNPKKLGLVPGLKTDHDKRPIDHLLTHDGVAKEHRELVAVPTSALCSAEASKDNPCRLKALVLLVRFSDHTDRDLPDPEVLFLCMFCLDLDNSLLNTSYGLTCRNMTCSSITTVPLQTTRRQREVSPMFLWLTLMIRSSWKATYPIGSGSIALRFKQ